MNAYPTSSPNVNLIERFWKFGKKQCLYSKYYPDSESFQQAIMACIEQAPILHKEALERWLTLRFHPCQAVAVIGANPTISKRSKKKVLPKGT